MTAGERTNELGMRGGVQRRLEREIVVVFKPIAGCCRLCVSMNAARGSALKSQQWKCG